jgi:hypothetical protein
MAYNERLCDERHDEIKAHLKEMRRLLYAVLIVLVASVVLGVAMGDPLMTARALLALIKAGLAA